MALDDGGERGGQPRVRVDAAHFAGLDERGDDGPVFGSGVVPCEQGVVRFKAMGRMVRSTVLVSISTRPSVKEAAAEI